MTLNPADLRAVGAAVKFTNDTSKTMVVPPSTQVGDRLVLILAHNNGSVPVSGGNPAGWVPVNGSPLVNSTFDAIYAWTKTASAGDAGSSVFNVGQFNIGVKGVAVILALSNTDPVNPVDVALTSTAYNTLGTTHAAPTATAVKDATPFLIATDRASSTVQATPSWTWPTGYTGKVAEQSAATLNAGDCSLGIAEGAEVASGATATPGNVTGNNLSHALYGLLLVRSAVPASLPQIEIHDDAGWHVVDVIGVGELGTIKAVTLVDLITGLHTPDLTADFTGGTFPNPPFSFTEGAAVTSAAADPNGSSGYGARQVPDPSTGFSSLTKADAVGPTGQPWASIKVRFRCLTLPPSSNVYDNLFELGNRLTTAPKGQFTVYWKNGVLWADFEPADAVNLGLVADGAWHTVEARVFFGATTYTAQVRIDGGTPIVMTSAPGSKTASLHGPIWFGYPATVSDYSRDIGSVKLSEGPTDPGWLT